MRRVIDGKIYNTETAEAVAESDARTSTTDFSYFEETLYTTKKGNWFLCGSGGPQTKYCECLADGGRRSGNKIVKMSALEAREWLESNDCTDELLEHFAEEITDA